MIKVNRKREGTFIEKIKISFMSTIKSKILRASLLALLIKTILFLCLISDDKANGVVLSRVFYSMPPIMVYLSFFCITFSFAFLFKGKSQLWSFSVINGLLTILYIGDIWYFRSNSSFLSWSMLKMTSNLDNLGSSVVSMARTIDLLFFIDLIFILIYSLKQNIMFEKVNRNVGSFLILIFLPILYLTYAHYKIDVYNKGIENQMIFRKSWSPNQTMSNLTPIGYHIFDGYNYYKESKPYVLSKVEENEVKQWFQKKHENLPDNTYKGLFKGKNLILIQWESLENFVINQKIDGQEITPNINKLLKNSIYFNNFYEQTYNGTSSDGELISLASVFPVREGATFFRYPNNVYVNSFPMVFKELGYTTLASHPDKGSYWNWMPSLKSMGFEKCIDSTSYNVDEVINLGISDKSYLRQLSEKIKNLKQPFFAYTVTLTSHAPFDLPNKDEELKLNENLEGTKLGGYFQSIRYTDKYVGEFINELDKNGLLDNTVIALYGDHEGVHKFYLDEIGKIQMDGQWWKENDKKIPLIIFSKNLKGDVKTTIGGQCDTLPTLGYLFGIDNNKFEKVMGRNLLNTNKNYAILSTRKFVGTESYQGEAEDMLKSIDYGDKLIRANFYSK